VKIDAVTQNRKKKVKKARGAGNFQHQILKGLRSRGGVGNKQVGGFACEGKKNPLREKKRESKLPRW